MLKASGLSLRVEQAQNPNLKPESEALKRKAGFMALRQGAQNSLRSQL